MTPEADNRGVATEPFALHEAVLDAQAKMGQGIVIVDIQSTKIVYANEAVAAMSGYTVEEILELPSFVALSPPAHAGVMEESRRRRVAGEDEPNEWDTVIHRKDGTRLDIEVSVSEIDGDPNRFVALLRDITRRKQAERALRESEARLRTLVTRAPVLMWTVGADRIFTMAEGHVLTELGVSSSELVGRTIEDVYTRLPHVLEHYDRAFAGEPTEATVEASGRTLQAHLLPIESEDGAIVGVVGVATDITDLAHTQARLSESEARHTVVLDALQEGVLMVDRLGRVLAANPAAQRILDPDGSELVGNTIADPGWQVVHEDGSPMAVEDFPVSVTLATGQPRSNEVMGLYRPDGTHTWISVNTQGVLQPGEELPRAVVISISDVTERRSFEAELRFLADHDALTGLPNRRRFHEELTRHLNFTSRYGGEGAVLLLDLDNFKYLNDSQGHKAGDQFLVSLARVLKDRLRQTDVVARLGGDEFGVLLPAADPVQARKVAELLQGAVREHAPLVAGQPVKLSTSIGIACFGHGNADPEQLMAAADLAMYDAKEAGRDRIGMATAETVDERSLKARMHWLERIRKALDDETFIIYCQPIAVIETGDISQYELLLRMEDENGHIVPATAFLATAERFDLVQEIDLWMVAQAIDLIAEHAAHGRALKLEVNISAKSIGDAALPQLIERKLEETEIDPQLLILEITETTAIANMDEAVEFATRLSRLGCGFALDDFGRGFGSFYYLKHLPLNYLKIDGDFVRNIAHNLVDQQVVKAVVQVAKALGYKTIAEYVQDEATVLALRHYGVDYMQGYHVGRPRALNPASSGFL
jgi:diguanylate cyclase (GGDEF)-like protein/PAS domain S-box-containing protein